MSEKQGPPPDVVETLDGPPLDHNPVASAIDEDATRDSGDDEPSDDTTIEAPKPPRGQRKATQWIRRSRATTGLSLLAVLIFTSAALASWMYVSLSRPDQQTDPVAEKAALTAATEGSVALLSYSKNSLDHDLAVAKSHLTGEFLTYYTKFTDRIVTPAAKRKSVKTAAAVTKAAVSEMHPDSAVLLLFINQTTTSSEHPELAMTTSSVLVTVNKVKGAWLIAKFEPV